MVTFRHHLFRAALTWVGLHLAAVLSGAEAPTGTVHLVADLLEAFPSAQVEYCADCTVRKSASAGDRKQDALFEHPQSGPHPARVRYDLTLPALGADQLLLLAFDVGLSDGIKLGGAEDGVRFFVEANGRALFSTEWRATRWQSHAVDLTPFAGQRVALVLGTDGLRNTSYDWALWGSPRLLHVEASRQQAGLDGKPNIRWTHGSRGTLVVRGQPNATIRLRPLGPGHAQECVLAENRVGTDPLVWCVHEFHWPGAQGVEIDWDTNQAIAEVRLAAYPPRLRLTQLTAAQAVVTAGSTVPLVAEVSNEGRGELRAGRARLVVSIDNQPVAETNLPSLEPGETWPGRWDWKAPAAAGEHLLQAHLFHDGATNSRTRTCEVVERESDGVTLQNNRIRLDFIRKEKESGFTHARIYTRQEGRWIEVGVWQPLFQIASQTKSGIVDWPVRPGQISRQALADGGDALEIGGEVRDPDGVGWTVRLNVRVAPDQPQAQMEYAWSATQPRQVHTLGGPNIYVGDGTVGAAKSWGLFPGLEYLFGAEPSSNPRDFAPRLADRRTPHPHKMTAPLMAVTLGPDSQRPPGQTARFFAPDSFKDRALLAEATLAAGKNGLAAPATVALWWDPRQPWDGAHGFPSARFASPNFDQAMLNHRLGLFLPGCPDFVPENAAGAVPPVLLPAFRSWKLTATLLVLPEPALAALREWIGATGGLPKPNPWPRTFQEELDLCRTGFLETVWDREKERWRHCIGWASSPAPGFAALLWLDGRLAERAQDQARSRERVERVAGNMLREAGPALFTSKAGCHIMQWEFPFYYGYLPEALTALEESIAHLRQRQEPDGGWRYQPGNAQQADLGQAGDSVLGTCANHAAALLRYARITGDAEARRAGEKALRFMDAFRVPRGGQTWECPMYEPDILAAAYAVSAYLDAYRISGDRRWLHQAVYWAESGVPFVYLWSLPDKPMMLGATIPVFGSTFYTHTWLGVPVQWCGLVYAYHVFHLARELERAGAPLPAPEAAPPLALDFSPADWRRVVELITVSALYQQFPTGDKAGTYPDSITQFEKRNPAFLNPEDILVNVLAWHGHGPDIKTVRLPTQQGEYLVSSGADVQQLQKTQTGLEFQLRFFPGDTSHTLAVGAQPEKIHVDGTLLPRADAPVRQAPGWWWDAQRGRLYLVVSHSQDLVQVRITTR